MKTRLLISVLCFCVFISINAQQWSGTSPIYTTNSNVKAGIGTSSPASKLTVLGATGSFYSSATTTPLNMTVGSNPELAVLDVNNAAGNTATIRLGTVHTTYYTYSAYIQAIQGTGVDSYHLTFGTGNATAAVERMRITSSGNVGIGTNSPTLGKVQIYSEDAIYSAYIQNQRGDATGNGLYVQTRWNTADNYIARFTTNSGSIDVMAIKGSGNVGVGGCINPQTDLHVGGYNFGLQKGNVSPNAGYIRFGDNTGWKIHIGRMKESPGGAINTDLTGALLTVQDNGNVGIGTTSPNWKLDLGLTNAITIGWKYNSANLNSRSWGLGKDVYAYGDFAIMTSDAQDYTLDLYRFYIDPNGNVGIGTISPGTYKLNVWGKIRAHEVVVNTTGADYVFDSDYRLLSLPEVEKYIEEYKHLPDLPSATELKENGMNVSDMQTKLLQKLEEMTLYIIEQNKKDELLNKEIVLLKREIEIIKSQINE